MNPGDTSVYGKGSIALRIFHAFPGAASPFGTEGSEWRISRKIMQSVLYNIPKPISTDDYQASVFDQNFR